MAKLEAAAIIAVVGVLAFIYLKVSKGVDTVTNVFSSVEKTFTGFSESVHDTLTMDRSKEVILQNQDSMNPNGFLQTQTRLNPLGSSNLLNWQTDRNIQIGRPHDTITVWGDINRMHSQTVPSNIQMLSNIQQGNASFFDNLKGYSAAAPKTMYVPRSGGVLDRNTRADTWRSAGSGAASIQNISMPSKTPTGFVNYSNFGKFGKPIELTRLRK